LRQNKTTNRRGVAADAFRRLALALPEALEAPHFDRPSFRVRGKIFATLSPEERRGVVKLTREQQELMSGAEPKIFAAVPSWEKHGWTYVHLQFADADTVRSALTTSWRNVAPKKLADSETAAKR
jgi:hypothetical protein